MQPTLAMETRTHKHRTSRRVRRAPRRRNIDDSFEHDEREIIIGGDDKTGEP